MPVRTAELATAHVVAVGVVVAATVPAGETWIWKEAFATVTAGTSVQVAMGIRRAGVLYIGSFSGIGNARFGARHANGFGVLEPGDELIAEVVQSTGAPVADFWFSGSKLQGIAP